ncbi:hypothetical protein [Enterococcus faecalis]|uniref:hypothetical protein n=1 Tax=Enterococcus faecalis TaxID=1351 RepID=UPI0018CE5094|nr:hypothetical protein [Enterococcus faecalis]
MGDLKMKKHVIVGCLLIVSSMFVSACGNSSDVTTEKTSVTKQVEATGQSTSSSVDQTKYDAIITEAKKLTAEGQYKESEEKLATIPVSDLGKPHYSIVKETVEKLNNQNNKGLKRQEEVAVEKQTKSSPAPTESLKPIPDEFAKWATTYLFYYPRGDQKQAGLIIEANGAVTQTNTNGEIYTGKAEISGASGTILSYDTTSYRPTTQPATKSITPNVKITVTWNNGGGVDVYYGYVSYSQRLALTDGIAVTDGVKEVWLS